MKEKYFSLMKNLQGNSYLEYYITYLISPVLTGVKPSSLISIGNDSRNLLGLWEKDGKKFLTSLNLKAHTLKRIKGKDIVLIYNEKNLREILNRGKSKQFLEKLGYEELGDLNMSLAHLNERYNLYHCPHEIGIFLGIPLHDVEAFMSCEGKECICCGYWKVFSNEAEAMKLFKAYDWSKEMVMKYSIQGRKIQWIADTLRDSHLSVAQ